MKLEYDNDSSSPTFNIVYTSKANFISSETSKRSSAVCPRCGYTTPRKNLVNQSKKGTLGFLLAAIKDTSGNYYLPNNDELEVHKNLISNKEYIDAINNISGELPYLRSIFNVNIYGTRKWSDLYLPRQLVSTYILATEIRTEIESLIKNNIPFHNEIATLLSLSCDAVAVANCTQVRWRVDNARTESAFSVQALPMLWNFAERNPVVTNLYSSNIFRILKIIDQSGHSRCGVTVVEKNDARNLPLPDESIDIIATDPPYYDYVPYGNLSDFFYIWQRIILIDLYPELFNSILVEKDTEIIQLAERNALYAEKTKEWFEKNLTIALTEAKRVIKPNGIMVLAFAHKGTENWEALVKAVVESGWKITGSWPINTELGTRMRAQGSAVLNSTIHLICRPRFIPKDSNEFDSIGDWRDILVELPKRINEWMPRLAAEGVVGADAIFSCLGPALEIFSRYSHVERANGEAVPLEEYLEQIWAVVAKEALSAIFTGADVTGFEEDARLTAMWLWTLNAGTSDSTNRENSDEEEKNDESESGVKKKPGGFALEYDAARKIAQGLGVHLEQLDTLVEINGEIARLLPVAERTKALFGKDQSETPKGRRKKKDPQLKLGFMAELEEAEEQSGSWGEKSISKVGETTLDRIHQAMILFAAGRGEALKRLLIEDGIGRDQRFWRLAQALSALYPPRADEKRWVDGVLARKKGMGF